MTNDSFNDDGKGNRKISTAPSNLREILSELDLDGDGGISFAEMVSAVAAMKEAKNQNRKLSRLVLILSLSIVLSLAAVFGVSVAAAYLAKDTKVSSDGVMANTKGEVVQVDTYFSPLEEDSTPSSNPTNTSRRLKTDAGSIVHSAPSSCGVEVEWLACLSNKQQRIFGSAKQAPKNDWIKIENPQGAKSISQKVILIDPVEKIVLDVRTDENNLCRTYANSPDEVSVMPVGIDEVSVMPVGIDEEVSSMPVTSTFNTWTLLKLTDGSWLAQLGGEHTPNGAQNCKNGTPTYRINHNFNPKEDLMKKSEGPWAVYNEERSASISSQSDVCWQHILCWR